MIDAETLESISPGVRKLVVWLNDQGFKTTDSGDGTNYKEGMSCALPFPMVAIECADAYSAIGQATKLHLLVSEMGVCFGEGDPPKSLDMSWSPVDAASVIVLTNITDADLVDLS